MYSIKRNIENILKQRASTNKAILLTGPRQVGKSTLINHLFKDVNKVTFDAYCLTDLNKIKETIKTNQAKAMVVVNSAMIMAYYKIGRIINERKIWGNKYIENLANDLGEYGNSYSFRNLKYMSQFSKEFSESEIRQQPVAQISWGTLITFIIPKLHSHKDMLWYIEQMIWF